MDLSLYYNWDVKNNTWQRRQRKVNFFDMVNMVPVGTELFYLHLLLTHVEVPTSFDGLFCFQNTVDPTYKVVYITRGLLQDDAEWDKLNGCLQCFSCLDNRWIHLVH